jgi:hypothetical protein
MRGPSPKIHFPLVIVRLIPNVKEAQQDSQGKQNKQYMPPFQSMNTNPSMKGTRTMIVMGIKN